MSRDEGINEGGVSLLDKSLATSIVLSLNPSKESESTHA
jgi:hypothetical protein